MATYTDTQVKDAITTIQSGGGSTQDIYSGAQKYGISMDQIDSSMGLPPGTSAAWESANITPASTPSTPAPVVSSDYTLGDTTWTKDKVFGTYGVSEDGVSPTDWDFDAFTRDSIGRTAEEMARVAGAWNPNITSGQVANDFIPNKQTAYEFDDAGLLQLKKLEPTPTPVRPTPTIPPTVNPTPVNPTPVNPTPVNPTPVNPTPVRPTPVNPTPVRPTPTIPPTVNPTPVRPTPMIPPAANPTSYSVDPSTQTVAGQMEGLLAAGSPYIDRARYSAAVTANARGLLNTSIAAGAGEAAAIDAALPMAQQDAQTYFAQANLNQNTENNFELFNTEFAYNDYFKDVDFANATALNEQQNAADLANKTALNEQQNAADLANKTALNDQQNAADLANATALNDQQNAAAMDLQTLQDAGAVQRTQMEIDANATSAELLNTLDRDKMTADNYQSFTSAVGTLSQQYQQSFSNLASNNDMDATAKQDAITELQLGYESQFNYFADLFAIDMDFVLPVYTPSTETGTEEYTMNPFYNSVEEREGGQ